MKSISRKDRNEFKFIESKKVIAVEKRILIFFGKTGAGKSYTAKIFGQEFGYYLYDADLDLTVEMREAIETGQVFTAEMRTAYFEVIKEKTKALLKSNLKIALAQGFFKNRNRQEFMEEFPFAKFIWVDADDGILERRILRRNSSVTLEYARRINQLFETPDFNCEKIINNGGTEELLNEARKTEAKLYYLGDY